MDLKTVVAFANRMNCEELASYIHRLLSELASFERSTERDSERIRNLERDFERAVESRDQLRHQKEQAERSHEATKTHVKTITKELEYALQQLSALRAHRGDLALAGALGMPQASTWGELLAQVRALKAGAGDPQSINRALVSGSVTAATHGLPVDSVGALVELTPAELEEQRTALAAELRERSRDGRIPFRHRCGCETSHARGHSPGDQTFYIWCHYHSAAKCPTCNKLGDGACIDHENFERGISWTRLADVVLDSRERALIKVGYHITAIKRLRYRYSGIGLREAKDICDEVKRGLLPLCSCLLWTGATPGCEAHPINHRQVVSTTGE